RTTARGAIWATALLVASSCLAQTSGYPNRPVKVIVPFPPGGATDVIVRLITQKLSVSLGQQFYAENHAGAGGNIGMGMAASAPADGYTVLAVTNSFILNPSLYAKIPYDPIRDFAPLSLPARSVSELIALVRANPGKYSYASAGLGTPGHLAGELFRSPLGLDLVHVPFSGGPPAINATIAGHTPVSFTALPTAAPQVKEGKLRALAVMSSRRAAALPDVPTMAEAGVPDCEVDIVAGMVVRSGTPDDIAQRLHGEIVKALDQPDIRERLSAHGFEPVAGTRDAFAAWIKAETPRWRRVIHGVNIPKVE